MHILCVDMILRIHDKSQVHMLIWHVNEASEGIRCLFGHMIILGQHCIWYSNHKLHRMPCKNTRI